MLKLTIHVLQSSKSNKNPDLSKTLCKKRKGNKLKVKSWGRRERNVSKRVVIELGIGIDIRRHVNSHSHTHIRHVNVSLLIRFYSTCVSPYPLIGFTFTEGLNQHGNNQTQQSPQQWNRTFILRLLICF